MKSTLQIVLVLMLVTVFASCKSNSTSASNTSTIDTTKKVDTTNNNSSTATMTATINGNAWTAQAGGYRHAGQFNNLSFEGFINSPFEQLVIAAGPNVNYPGTYPLVKDPANDQAVAVYTKVPTPSYDRIITGSVTFSVFTNTNVQGTFYFTATNSKGDTVTITNGKFNAPLQ